MKLIKLVLFVPILAITGCASGYAGTICESTTTTDVETNTETQTISCENQGEQSGGLLGRL